jgi:hypothetical protein
MLLSQILIISVNNFLFFKAWIKFNVDKRHIYFPTITQLSIESPHKNNSQLDSPSIEHYPINHLLRSLPSETKKKKTIIWLLSKKKKNNYLIRQCIKRILWYSKLKSLCLSLIFHCAYCFCIFVIWYLFIVVLIPSSMILDMLFPVLVWDTSLIRQFFTSVVEDFWA